MRQSRRSLLLGLALALGAAGCSGVPETPESPIPTPTASSTPTGTGSPTPTPEPSEDTPTPEPLPLPDYPEDLTAEDTAENAIRAAEYFIDLMNYAQSTGDTDPFLAVSLESCKACVGFADRVALLYSSEGFSVGNEISLGNPTAERTKDYLAWVVLADWLVSEGLQFDGDLGEVKPLGSMVLEDHRVGVQLVEDQWLLLTFAKAAVE